MRFEFLPAFKGDCFLIHAGTADAPSLILVDGGPSGTYEQHLKPRLLQLREERGLEDHEPLVIDLVMVSHVDDDHINGIIDLFQELADAAQGGSPTPFEIGGLWHNSFDEIVGNDEVAVEAAQFGPASFTPLIEDADEPEQHDAGLILQSVAQGHRLRELAQALDIPINDSFDGLIKAEEGSLTQREIGGITFTVVGPRPAELRALQKSHDAWIKHRKAQGKAVTPASILQSLSDQSVANLSSIVLLAERDGRRVLLTGDARSDYILRGLEEIGLVEPGGSFSVDLLKMPHHGSDRNVHPDFLRRITASDYLFTGNGEHGNPERETFRMLADARPGAAMNFHLTYSVATIDAQRRHVHEIERAKEIRKHAALRRVQAPRSAWSDEEHSLSKLFETLGPGIRAVEPSGPCVLL